MKGTFLKVVTALTVFILSFSAFGCSAGAVIQPNKTGDGVTPEAITPEEIIIDSGSGDESTGEWIPDIVVKEDDTNIFDDDFDDSVKYTYNASTVTFKTVAGSLTTAQGSGIFTDFTTTAQGSMAVCTTQAFPYGTISVDVKTLTNTDSGIVFGLSDSGANTYWEGNGVSYYFFFLGQDGTVYLGKTDNGRWYVVKIVDFTFNANTVYNLKVVYKGSAIYGFVDGDLKFAVRDSEPLSGTGFGVRSGASGVQFTNLTVTNDYVY